MKLNSLQTFLLFSLPLFSVGCNDNIEREHSALRAPVVPLVTIDPYTSLWSFSDCLYESVTKHWSGKNFPMQGVLSVDGEFYRFMGEDIPVLNKLIGTSEQEAWYGRYTFDQPSSGWMEKDFNDKSWKAGEAAFGTMENEPTAKTQWGSKYIWLRREIEINEDVTGKNVYLTFSHDDDAIVYVNGVKVVETGNTALKNVSIKLSSEAVATLKQGEKSVIAAYCWNRQGNALLDLGLSVEADTFVSFKNTAIQKNVEVMPMQTYYFFTCGPIDLNLTFTAPAFADDLDLYTRPINYITYNVNSTDGANHDIKVYFEASPLLALDNQYQESLSLVEQKGSFTMLKTGSVSQNILKKKGDDVRIDWGHFYMTTPKNNTVYGVGEINNLHKAFINGEGFSLEPVANGSLALVTNLGNVKNGEGHILVGYDDIKSIQYFGENLRPYWNRSGNETIEHQFELAEKQYGELMKKSNHFDNDLMKSATKAGGRKYAELCALAYRQVVAAHKLVESSDGDLLLFSKENFSNGSIGTVDITYPTAPFFLVLNPELCKATMNHIFYYSESGKWKKPFAAHDVGTYPQANGQTYGGDMPVEESGNMVITTCAIAMLEGNANYAEKHWDVLTTWTNYLTEYGMDPENQLCTDDFAGHFAHNANLSIKAIVGIGAYAKLASMLGKEEVAEIYMSKAKEMAANWVVMANDGDHYKLTFDKPGTWSQKYNLVWDKLLGLELFPAEVSEKEIAYYLTKQNRYGLPLDSREDYTKTDWIMWTATIADTQEEFCKFIDPVYDFMNKTQDRVPMSDWIYTSEAVHRGFQARSVVGGYYIKMLENLFVK